MGPGFGNGCDDAAAEVSPVGSRLCEVTNCSVEVIDYCTWVRKRPPASFGTSGQALVPWVQTPRRASGWRLKVHGL